MAKLTLNTIGSRYGSIDALNANFDAIETALENTLSRDGTLPNNMDANLDMDSNRIINLADAIYNADAVTLRQVNGLIQGASNGIVSSLRENFVATNGQTVFNIASFTYIPGSNNLAVYIDGVRQYPGISYIETDNNTITFSAGVHTGALVMLISNESVDTANLNALVQATFYNDKQVWETTATSGQTVFNLPFIYIPGSKRLAVYVNGVKQSATSSYTETNSATVTFTQAVPVTAKVEFNY